MLKFRAFFLTVALAAGALPVLASPSPVALPAQAPAAPAPAPQAPAPQTQVPAAAASTTQMVPTVCGQPIPVPSNLPPAGSAPVVYLVVPCFQKQGGYSVVEPQTYLYYLQMTQHVSS